MQKIDTNLKILWSEMCLLTQKLLVSYLIDICENKLAWRILKIKSNLMHEKWTICHDFDVLTTYDFFIKIFTYMSVYCFKRKFEVSSSV